MYGNNKRRNIDCCCSRMKHPNKIMGQLSEEIDGVSIITSFFCFAQLETTRDGGGGVGERKGRRWVRRRALSYETRRRRRNPNKKHKMITERRKKKHKNARCGELESWHKKKYTTVLWGDHVNERKGRAQNELRERCCCVCCLTNSTEENLSRFP